MDPLQWNPGLTIFGITIIPGITINIRLPSKSYSKMYGAEPRYNDHGYNDIPGLTMGMSLTEHKIFPVIMRKSKSQTTGNANNGNEHLMSCTNWVGWKTRSAECGVRSMENEECGKCRV